MERMGIYAERTYVLRICKGYYSIYSHYDHHHNHHIYTISHNIVPILTLCHHRTLIHC